MAYNQFKKLSDLRKNLGINEIVDNWLPNPVPTVQPTQRLMEDLKEAADEALSTEKSKSESIIAPMIKELKRQNPDRFSFFSGFEFDVAPEKGLKGFCDFILSADTKRAEITSPIFCLVEAKNDQIEKGIAQCGAEMYAAFLYNEQEGNPKKVIYGASTTAFLWCFLKLEGHQLYIDNHYIPLTFHAPQEVLGVLQWIVDQSVD